MPTPKSLGDTRPSKSPANARGDLVAQRQHIGRYEIIYPIAQGGMASVYVARLSGMAGFEKLYAIKVIHPHLSEDESYINMFLDEARLAAGIQHPNVAEIFEVGHDDGVLYMVGEFVHGQSLRAFYSRAATLGVDVSQPVAAYIVSRVCQGLQAAHDHRGIDEQPLNLVHRDISPSNILISYDGFVKVIDFGVAYAQGRLSQTMSGTIKGKIGFLPPEQIRGSQLDQRADIFSLGVVLYIMATGVPPFRGVTEAEQIYKVLNGRFPLPREANPSVHPMLERIILTAMALRREDRYPSADAMRKDLVRFIRKSGAQVGSEGLSKLMRSLFAEDLARHKELVKEFRARQRARTRQPGQTEDPTPSPLPIEDLHAQSLPATRPHRTEVVSRTVDPLRKHWQKTQALLLSRNGAMLGVAVISAIIAFLVMSLRAPDKASPANRAMDVLSGPLSARSREIAASLAQALERASKPHPGQNPTASSTAQRTMRLTLTLRPTNARVLLDGQSFPAGTTQIELPADGRRHIVEVSAPGHRSVARRFIANQDQSFVAKLSPLGKRSQGKWGNVDISIRKSPYD